MQNKAKRGTSLLPVVFLHIPKTAGTSFISLLRAVFGHEQVMRLEVVDYRTPERLAALLSRPLGEIDCVAAHIPYTMVARHRHRCRLFILLRHPVVRVMSLFRFLQQRPAEDQKALGLASGFSFDDFINTRTPSLFVQVNDGMTRALAGDPRVITPDNDRFWDTTPSASLVERALANLESADFGLAEDMDATVGILRSAWGIPYGVEMPYENVSDATGTRHSVEHSIQVIQRNQMDIALYQQAAAIFRRRCAALSEVGDGGIAVPILKPRMGKVIPIAKIPAIQGFHPVEASGIAWLRAEQRVASIRFESLRGPVRIGVVCYVLRSGFPAEETELTLNGIRVATGCSWRNEGWCTLVTEPVELHLARNTLTIRPPYFVPVRFMDPASGDPRSLGLAVAALTFEAWCQESEPTGQTNHDPSRPRALQQQARDDSDADGEAGVVEPPD